MTTKPKPENPPAEPEVNQEALWSSLPISLRSAVNESPVSANVFVISPAGGNYQFTIRSHAVPEDFYSVMENIAIVEESLVNSGWTFKQIGESPRKPQAQPQGQAPLPSSAPQGQAPLPQHKAEAPQGSGNSKDDNTFPALELVAEVKSGKVYWAVVSASTYPKFPTRIWREPLDKIGTDIESLDPNRAYKLSGYTAVFVRNENGNPSKVVELIPPEAPPF